MATSLSQRPYASEKRLRAMCQSAGTEQATQKSSTCRSIHHPQCWSTWQTFLLVMIRTSMVVGISCWGATLCQSPMKELPWSQFPAENMRRRTNLYPAWTRRWTCGNAEDPQLPEEDEIMEDAEEKNVEANRSMHETWHKLVDEAKNAAVKQITFVEPVKSRAVKHVLPALGRIYCRLRSLGLPLYRLHSDRAREFCSEQVRSWTMAWDVVTNNEIEMTPGSSYKTNGRLQTKWTWSRSPSARSSQHDWELWPNGLWLHATLANDVYGRNCSYLDGQLVDFYGLVQQLLHCANLGKRGMHLGGKCGRR